MSKAKKIISMLLVVVMVLTVAPVSGFAALADQGFEYVTPTLTPTTFTVDTTATTKVTRIAAGHNSLSLSNGSIEAPHTIVNATPSGIPKVNSVWSPVAYAGESPSAPYLVFKITGATLDKNPSITPNIGGVTMGPVDKTTSGNVTTYTWEIKSGDSGIASGAGTDLVFEIDYQVNDVAYTAYGHSHVENIIVMNGFAQYRHRKNSDDYTRHAMIGQYQSRNMYTRMNGANLVVSTGTEADSSATSVSNRVVGYINYAAGEDKDGGSLIGCGSGTDFSSAANAYGSAAPNGAIPGDEQPALIKGNNTDDAVTRNICTDNDTNRGEPVIYLDAGTGDTLDSLNFRFTLQSAESSDFAGATLDSIRFVQPGAANLKNDCAISDEIYTQTGTAVPSSQIEVKGLNYGSTGNASVPGGAEHKSYVMAKFGGPGPAANSSLNDNYTVFASWHTLESKRGAMQTTGGMNLIFRRYDTTDLRALYNGVIAGNGSVTFNKTSGLTGSLALNKGKNPQASMYNINSTDRNGTAYSAGETDWTMFETALKTAGSLLARPDLNQTQIDNATKALREAYLNLEGYSDTYYVEIWHCLAGTNGTEADIIKAKDGTVLKQLVNGGNPVASGQVLASKAATITGYTVTGESVLKTPISGKTDPETGTNKMIIRYYYQPKDVYINVAPNNPGYNNYMQTVGYNTTVDLTATNSDGTLVYNYGEREFYTFAGWLNSYDNQVYDVLSASGKKSFTMPDEDLTLKGQWVITPLKVIGVPVTNKGVVFDGKQLGDDIVLADESSTVQFAEPTKYVSAVATNGTKTYKDGRYLNDGYLFGGYYENYDAATQTFSNPVSWPLSFSFGDSDKTIYIRWVDVNGTVSFETNGGSEIEDISYSTTPAEITAPANPTKAGYDFVQWHSTEALNSPILADDGTVWTAGKTKTQQTQTGFLAYAEWTAQTHSITFNMGDATSDFDTTTAEMAPLYGESDSPVNPADIPPAPTKYGKVFAQWVIQGTNTVYKFDVYPKEDIVLVPVWNETPYSAFVSLGAYEKLATGENVLVAPTSTAPGSAQAGDVVTFRMTSLTNFYTGSSVFVFMYDKNFYELVAEGTNAFVLNSENEYVAGIEASAYGVTNDTTLGKLWPAELTTEPNNIRANYNAMMVTIDPTVSSGNFNCEPMSDGKWLIEFQLKVKDTATEGDSGTVYMSNEWTRTANNIMGTMFYGWAASGETSVADTFNNVVTPNLDKATATIQIDPTPVNNTTVILNPNGGMWADGTTDAVTYTGREATEIFGYTTPTREGYEIEKDANGNAIWYKLNDDGTVDTTVTWIEGYYATAETDGLTFVPSWKGMPFTVNYYVEEGADLWGSENVLYGNPITGPFYSVEDEKAGYVFAGWQDADGNVYVEDETLVPLGGVDLYAIWEPGSASYTINITYFDKQNSVDKTVTRTGTAKTDSRVELVEEAGTQEGVTYVLWSELPIIRFYEFDSANTNNEFVIEKVNGDGSSVINVYYKASTFTYTFDATEGGTFPTSGERYMSTSGEYYDPFSVTSIETPVKDGYVFKAWTPNAANISVYNQDRTFTATWDVRKISVTFNAGEGNFGTGTDGAEIKTTTSELTYDSSITKPATNPTRAGYDFLGWAATPDGDVIEGNVLGTATDYDNGHTFYAKWQKASYGVTYLLDGAVYGETENVEFEGTVTVRDYPADIEGYSFVGWTYDGTTYAPGQTITMPNGAIYLEGEFVADEFDAVFDAAGGYFGSDETATTTTVKVFYDDIGTSPAKPVRSGYEFLGYTDTEGSATIVLQANAAFTMDAEGKTYYAVWKATIADYTIEYYEMAVDGTYPAAPTSTTTRSGNVEGTVSAPVNVPTGFTLDEEDTVTAEKSILSGTVTPAPNNLVLKVYYSRNQYTVYTIVDGVRTEAGKFYYGADVTVADPPAKEGHTVAWSPAVTSPMEAQDQELTAVYTAVKYTVTFISDGETVKTQEVAYGTALSAVAPAVQKTGYTADGWAYEGTTDKLDLTAVTVPVGGVTLVALWKINSNTVNFRANGGTYADGSNNKAITVAYGKEVAAPEVPTRAGYTFTGWMDNSTKVVYPVGETLPAMIDGVVNYVAQWQIETYTVNFVIDGTTISETYTYGADIVIPDETQTVKEGWTFKYWTDAQGNEVEPEAVMGDIGENGASITYTAYFEINSYKATFISEGATVEEKTYNYNAAVNKPATEPTKTGYTFKGWKAADGTVYGAEQALPVMGKADVTYTAYFEINSYKATFISEGATVEEKTYNYNAAVNKPATEPTKTGYTFVAWVGADGTEYDKDTALPVMGTADVTYTAKFTINSYTATFTAEGTPIETKSYEYGASVNKPSTNPSKEGYTFKGWKAADGTVYGENDALPVMGTADVSYTAYFEINSYKVTWVFENGSENQVDTYEYNKAVTMATKPSKTGHTFAGWMYSETGEIFADGAAIPAMIAKDVTYTAQWNIDSYKVTFMVDNAEYDSKTYAYNTAVNKPDVPVKTGYTFKGWKAADGTLYGDDQALPVMGTENVVYTAEFEINQYTVKFDAGDGKFILIEGTPSIYTIKQDYNTMATKPSDPAQTGYTFKGWTAIEGGQEADIIAVPATWYIAAENVDYYAVWTINTYTVTYLDADGEVAYTKDLDYGTKIQAPEAYDAAFVNPELEYYTFEGWSLTEVPEKLDKEAVAVYVIDFAAADAPTVPANDIVIYPAFARVIVKLALPENSTAIVELDDEAEGIVGYVTGLETLLDEDTLLSTYLAVEGDGSLKVTLTKYRVCGTGTKVEVIDNVTGKTVETYYLIIYGDVNGDAGIDATDASMVYTEAAGLTAWANKGRDEYDYCKVKAANVSGDSYVDATDATAIDDVSMMIADIDQQTGNVEFFYI